VALAARVLHHQLLGLPLPVLAVAAVEVTQAEVQMVA
jgi:hypothetical protein